MSQFTHPSRIEDVTPDEWDFGITGAIDSLLMEGKDPFNHPEELEARVLEILAESEWATWEDGDIEDDEFVNRDHSWADGLDFVDLSDLDVTALRAGRHVS